jgi:hypothetical protein
VGKRFIADMATKNSPSYSVEIVGQEHHPLVITLYGLKLPPEQREWWHSRKSVMIATDLPNSSATEPALAGA